VSGPERQPGGLFESLEDGLKGAFLMRGLRLIRESEKTNRSPEPVIQWLVTCRQGLWREHILFWLGPAVLEAVPYWGLCSRLVSGHCPAKPRFVVNRKAVPMPKILPMPKMLLPIFVALCAGFALLAPPATAQPQTIGSVTRVQGFAVEAAPGALNYDLVPGRRVHEGGRIITGRGARLEIRFDDDSVITIGEKATVTLDEFRQRSAAPANPVTQAFGVLRGTFRFVTGLIGQTDRSRVRVRTPVATIGIRGTDFFGGPLEAGMPPGQLHYGFMIIDGAIDVENIHGTVTLDEPEEGTFLPMDGGKAPTPPRKWGAAATSEAYASIAFQ